MTTQCISCTNTDKIEILVKMKTAMRVNKDFFRVSKEISTLYLDLPWPKVKQISSTWTHFPSNSIWMITKFLLLKQLVSCFGTLVSHGQVQIMVAAVSFCGWIFHGFAGTNQPVYSSQLEVRFLIYRAPTNRSFFQSRLSRATTCVWPPPPSHMSDPPRLCH